MIEPRLAEREGEQARAKQDKAGHSHSEETVRSEFLTHGATTCRWGNSDWDAL
jgi:hypothetical protein